MLYSVRCRVLCAPGFTLSEDMRRDIKSSFIRFKCCKETGESAVNNRNLSRKAWRTFVFSGDLLLVLVTRYSVQIVNEAQLFCTTVWDAHLNLYPCPLSLCIPCGTSIVIVNKDFTSNQLLYPSVRRFLSSLTILTIDVIKRREPSRRPFSMVHSIYSDKSLL